jgi:hypothetical protein
MHNRFQVLVFQRTLASGPSDTPDRAGFFVYDNDFIVIALMRLTKEMSVRGNLAGLLLFPICV